MEHGDHVENVPLGRSGKVSLSTKNHRSRGRRGGGGGQLVVFSNYAYAHRVTKMTNTDKTRPASRDFLALFIVDPAHPLGITAQQFLLEQAQEQSSTSGTSPASIEKEDLRMALLREQMAPAGEFGSKGLTAAGNGCFGMLGWLEGREA